MLVLPYQWLMRNRQYKFHASLDLSYCTQNSKWFSKKWDHLRVYTKSLKANKIYPPLNLLSIYFQMMVQTEKIASKSIFFVDYVLLYYCLKYVCLMNYENNGHYFVYEVIEKGTNWQCKVANFAICNYETKPSLVLQFSKPQVMQYDYAFVPTIRLQVYPKGTLKFTDLFLTGDWYFRIIEALFWLHLSRCWYIFILEVFLLKIKTKTYVCPKLRSRKKPDVIWKSKNEGVITLAIIGNILRSIDTNRM